MVWFALASSAWIVRSKHVRDVQIRRFEAPTNGAQQAKDHRTRTEQFKSKNCKSINRSKCFQTKFKSIIDRYFSTPFPLPRPLVGNEMKSNLKDKLLDRLEDHEPELANSPDEEVRKSNYLQVAKYQIKFKLNVSHYLQNWNFFFVFHADCRV